MRGAVMLEIIITYFHVLGFVFVFASLAIEHMLFEPTLNARAARRLAIVDLFYGISALIVIITGLLKIFVVGKPASFYLHVWPFHAKMTLFLLILVLSAFPSRHFIKNRNLPESGEAHYPAAIKMILRLELLLFVFIPFLALMMARGYGYMG